MVRHKKFLDNHYLSQIIILSQTYSVFPSKYFSGVKIFVNSKEPVIYIYSSKASFSKSQVKTNYCKKNGQSPIPPFKEEGDTLQANLSMI